MGQMLYSRSHRLPNLTLHKWCSHPGVLRLVTQALPHTTLDGAVFTDYSVSGGPCSCAVLKFCFHARLKMSKTEALLVK